MLREGFSNVYTDNMLCSSVQLINVEYAYERSVYVCVCVSTLYNKFIHHVSVHVKYLYHFRVLAIYVKCSNLRVNVGEIERERETAISIKAI